MENIKDEEGNMKCNESHQFNEEDCGSFVGLLYDNFRSRDGPLKEVIEELVKIHTELAE